MDNKNHWVAVWGNAVSVAENRPEQYAKNITLRYPIYIPFAGRAVRLTFDNFTGTEPITLHKTTVLAHDRFSAVTFAGREEVTIPAGQAVVSDPVEVETSAGETVHVSFYLANYTQMRAAVHARGPLCGGVYSTGNTTDRDDLDPAASKAVDFYYFLTGVSVLTEERNRAIICYGDSLTAQDWPDFLALRCTEEGYDSTAVVRKGSSGARILRQYDCLAYESYGLKGSTRFPREVPNDGTDTVIILQGINDIIHPVGEEVNIFRPMSDLPTAEELIQGLVAYIHQARSYGYRVYVGTLLPMGGWRTDAAFRQQLRHAYNTFIRTTDLIDGCIDFDKALEDPERPNHLLPEYDSGDHLHPSPAGYRRMAMEVPCQLLK